MSSNLDLKPSSIWNFYNNPRHPYDEFVPTYILKRLKLVFVHKHYDRLLAAFIEELPEVMHHFSTVFGPGGHEVLTETIKQIEKTGITTLFACINEVPTRIQAEGFLKASGILQINLLGMMDYFKQWWFPFPATLRQLVDEASPTMDSVLDQLKAVKIANSMTLLDAAAERNSRLTLAQQLGIADTVLLDLVHRADVSRLPYTSGGAVKRLWVMGYRSLAALRAADPQDYAARAEAYFAMGGKGTTFDSRMEVIQGFLADARHAPEVVD